MAVGGGRYSLHTGGVERGVLCSSSASLHKCSENSQGACRACSNIAVYQRTIFSFM